MTLVQKTECIYCVSESERTQ